MTLTHGWRGGNTIAWSSYAMAISKRFQGSILPAATAPAPNEDCGLAKMNELRVADGNLRTSPVTGWRLDASVIPAIDDVCSMPESPSTGADLQATKL